MLNILKISNKKPAKNPVIRLFRRYSRKCSEQLHDENLRTVASDIMYVKLFIFV